jgi:DNA polymerase-3 subunit beta
VVVVVRGKVDAPGSFTVPARTLGDFVGLLPNERIDFELVGGELALSCGKTSTKIKGLGSDEFPVLPASVEGSGFTVSVEAITIALNRVLPAIARNEIRPELSGVYFGFNTRGVKSLVLAATDSYRLAEQAVSLESGVENLSVVVPGRTAQEIARSLASAEEGEKFVRLLVSENQLVVNYDSVQIISRLVAGQYPDYTQIIPQQFKTTLVVNTGKLQKEMKAAGLFTTSGVNAVTVEINPEKKAVSLSAASQQTGEYASEVDGEVEGEAVTVLLNHRYVLDGLGQISSAETKLQLAGPESPCLLTAEKETGFRYIVMPIRQ